MKIFGNERVVLSDKVTDSKGPGEITIEEHAADRLQLLWYDLNILYNIAPDSPEVVTTITSAKAQGRVARIVGNQAAHSNFMAGASTNLLSVFKRQIYMERKVNRSIGRVMLSLGFTQKDIANLKKASIGKIEKVFSKVSAAGGVFSTSRKYGAARQRTHEFAPDVNIVDSQMEKFVRIESSPILNKVIRGAIGIKKAFLKIRKYIISHFQQAQNHLDAVIAGIEEYQLLSKELNQIENSSFPCINKSDMNAKVLRMKKLKDFFRKKNQRGCGSMKIAIIDQRLETLKRWRLISACQENGSKQFVVQQKPLTEAEKCLLLHPLEIAI